MDWRTRIKTTTKAALCLGYKYSGVLAIHEMLNFTLGQTGMTILVFHRVTDAIAEDGLTVSTARFRRMCRMLRKQFRVVRLGEIFDIVRTRKPFPPRTVAITFDDSYRDNLPAACVLAEYGLPATFFIPTGFVGTDLIYPWDAELGVRLPHLSWADIHDMVRLGMEIGSHTVSHPNMGVISPEEARTELSESKRILEDKLEQPVRWFAYPFGGREHFRPEFLQLVREAGYEGCVSAIEGQIFPRVEQPILPRVAAPNFHSLLNLELHLLGCLHWVYAAKKKMYWEPGQDQPRLPEPTVRVTS